jgi:urea transporter
MPFVVSSWLLFALVEFSSLVTLEQSTLVSVTTVTLLDYFQGALRGVAQIMLQDNWLTGVIFLFALLVQDYKVGLWALAGSVLSIQLASLFGFAEALILLGLYGYNGCLVAIALSAIYPKKYGLILFALVTSLLMMQLFIEFSLPALTAPFVLSTWLAIVLNVSSAKRLKAAIIDD